MPDSLDAHYETVIRELIAGRVILFLGPDVNLCGRPEGLAWSGRQDEHLPSNGELAAHLAEKFRYPSSKTQVSCPTCQSEISLAEKTRNLTRVSQYVAVTRGTGRLYEELHSLFNTEDYLPNAVYEFLSTLPGVLRATVHLHPAGVQAAGAASEERAPWQKYLSRLRRILTTRFDVGELRGLCFDLGVDYDDLPAEGKANKALELVMYLERRRQVPELIKMGKDLRTDIPWPEWPPRTADVLRRQLLIVTTNYDDLLERAF